MKEMFEEMASLCLSEADVGESDENLRADSVRLQLYMAGLQSDSGKNQRG